MGQRRVEAVKGPSELRAFTRAVLRDLDALEALLRRGGIESGIRRAGIEQEMFLIREDGRPAPVATELLARAADPRLTSELATFNLEANLPPRLLRGRFLREIELELEEVVARVDAAGKELSAHVLLTGTLPSLTLEDLELCNITPELRFRALNQAVMEARGGPYPVFIRGTDELSFTHDSVMLESANTSFQVHLQVSADEFARMYNLAQLITAPLLAAAANSPLLLGRRLWHETRVAVFERSVDARSSAQQARGSRGRVSFGDRWVDDSVLEIYRDDAARHRVLLTGEHEDDPRSIVESGGIPELSALALHTGTVWRWNRACYGADGQSAHLRIENRVLPAGPSILDEVANAALFWGMMLGLTDLRVAERIDFQSAKSNFVSAAREGLSAQLTWLDGRTVPARTLLLEELIPAARAGLTTHEVPTEDLDRYLGTVEERVTRERTGARFILESFNTLTKRQSADSATRVLTVALRERQQRGEAVHDWTPLPPRSTPPVPEQRTIAELMSTDLFTVRPDDVVELAASVMGWRRIRHVPVEDAQGRVCGILSHRMLIDALARGGEPPAVSELMATDPCVVDSDLPLRDAIRRLLDCRHGCLLVVRDERLIGIVTERDLLRAAQNELR